MSDFSNLEFFMTHLPARYRRTDAEQGDILRRLMTPFCEELDAVDEKYETFHQRINPDTAPEEFIDWWLYALFGWAWFPEWFTLERKRIFFRDMAQHYARRGTVEGIRLFLEAFGLKVSIQADAQYFGEAVAGEPLWSVVGPLGFVIRLSPEADAVQQDLEFFGEATAGESFAVTPSGSIQRRDIDELIRFVAPAGHIILVEELQTNQFGKSPTALPVTSGWVAAI